MRNQLLVSIFGLGLSACGGGAGDMVATGSGALNDDGGTGYLTLARRVAETSTLGGTRVGGDGEVRTISGTYDHDTGVTQFADGTVTLNASSGNGLTSLDDGTTQVSVFAGSGLTTQMQFVTPVTITAPIGSGSAILGIATDPADMPTSATASYVGQASVNVAFGGAFEMNGTATTDADFGANRVDVTLNGFSSSSNPAPFDTLRISNMAISGSIFTGGALSTTQDGRTIDIVGTSPTFDSRGGFFGFDSENNIPAEIGGGFYAEGSGNEIITGIYTGD